MRRATSPEKTSAVSSKTPRKLSAENAPRNLFPRVSRTSYDDVLPAEQWTSTEVDQPVKLQMGERELGQKPITITSVLRLNVEKYPERHAYAYRSEDKWRYVTFKDLFELVTRAAKGFIAFGLQRFYGVAIIGCNAPEWVIANFAAIYAGGIVVPVPAALSFDDYFEMMERTRCSIIVVGSIKQLEKVAEIRSQLPNIKAIIKYGQDDDETSIPFHTWEKLLTMGDRIDSERLKERIQFQAPNLCCTILHTPGATGPSKPVMLSQDNFIWTARTLGRRLSCSVASGIVMCILPYAHINALIFNLYVPMLFASTVCFVSSPNIFEWTREIQPSMIYAPRLAFEELQVKTKSVLRQSYVSRLIYFWWAKSVGLKGYKAITRRRPMPFGWTMANRLVFQKIRYQLGLQFSREVLIGGRLRSEQVLKFFASLNIPVLEFYGMAEASGPITVSAIPDMFRITSVGKDMDGCFTKIEQADKNGVGDIKIRGRNVCMGYLNQPDLTSEAFDQNGWFKTGDYVRRDEQGFLYVIGKASEYLTLHDGEMIASTALEAKAREYLPFCRHCYLVGNGRPYVAMLITIKTVMNWQTLEVSDILTPEARKWFRKMRYKDDSIEQFVKNPDKRILNKIQSIVDRLNKTEPATHRIQKWTVLPNDFTVSGGEMTWTLNFRRFVIDEKYAATIESLYVNQ